MPTYDFLCSDCGRKFDCFTPMGTAKAVCPGCGNTEAAKQFTALAGIIFKGSGFYKTDSQPKTASSSSSSSTSAPAEGSAKTPSSDSQSSSSPSAATPSAKTEKSGPCCGGSCGS